MAKATSSERWLKEHFDDIYVKKSQAMGYRSRASFKLIELDSKDKLFAKGMRVVDLGAAPGGWSQVAAELIGERGKVIASDILPMEPIAGVEFIQGDFTEEKVFTEITKSLNSTPVDLVISDMAPNISGVVAIDQPAAMYLVELALDMASRVLKPEGVLVVKVFQGTGFDEFLRDMRNLFAKVVTRKPQASRPRSKEVYLIGKGFKG